MREYINKQAPEKFHLDNIKIIKFIVKNFPDKSIPILDLGCGSGHLLNALSKQNYTNLTGVDFKTPPNHNKNTFKFIQRNLNYDDIKINEKFKLIVSSHTIEHLKFPYHLIDIAYEVLKEDGYFILVHPDMSNLFHRFNFLFKGENMRFNKDNSNNVFITNNIFKRILFGSGVYNIKNTTKKPRFIIKKRISSSAILPILNIKLPNIKILEGSVIYILEKND